LTTVVQSIGAAIQNVLLPRKPFDEVARWA
jgi:hypothetical protein